MKQLYIIQCCEDIARFRWEAIIQLSSARKYGLSDKFRVIVFLPSYRNINGFSKEWKNIEQLFPETKFFYYSDPRGSVTDLMINYNYHNVHRLCSLERHFKEYPELEKSAIFYIDSDVIFTDVPTFITNPGLLDDDVNYLSDVHTYMNVDYLNSKASKDIKTGQYRFLKDELADKYIGLDVIGRVAKLANIDKDVLIANNTNVGGAQYLFKNISSKFFSECIDICLKISMFFKMLNQEFFKGSTRQEREDTGIQSYCADMWAIQWNLYKHSLPSQTPKWMDFAWATDKMDRLKDVWMLHNAGITTDEFIRATENLKGLKNDDGSPLMIEAPAFFKNAYNSISVFDNIKKIEIVANNPYSQQYCTSYYAQCIIDTYNSLIKTKNNESTIKQ